MNPLRKLCKKCSGVCPYEWDVCPACGTRMVVAEERDGQLVEVER